MSLLNALLTSYSLSNLLKLIYNSIGATPIIIFLIALVGLFAYVASLPINSAFMAYDKTLVAREFLGHFMYYLFGVTFFLIVVLNFEQILWFMAFAIPLVLLIIYNSQWFRVKWNYKEYEDFHNGKSNFGFIVALIDKRFLGINLITFVLLGEILLIVYANPSLSILTWVFVLYIFFITFMFIALAYGVTKRLTSSTPISLVYPDGAEVKGYLIARSPDHYLIITSEKMLAIHTNMAKEIIFEKYD